MSKTAKKFNVYNTGEDPSGASSGSSAPQNGESILDVANESLQEIPSEPVIVELEDDGSYAVILMPDGVKYELRHPGVRAVRKAKDDAMDLKSGRFLMEKYLDSLFRNVFRHGDNPGPKPTQDNISISMASYFEQILPLFADGKLAALGSEEDS